MEIKEGDIVLCTVKSMEGTTVFVHIEENGEGSITLSEVAAGRIRNIREYVVPNKKIVCKVLKISGKHVELSLRRVTGKEREEVVERSKKELAFKNILKTISKNPEKIIEKIKKKYELVDFFDRAKENNSILNEVLTKDEAQSLLKIFSEKHEKEKVAKRTITLKTLSPSGLYDIQDSIKVKNAEIRYLGSSKFSISVTGKDFKEANLKIQSIIQQIEKKAKEKKIDFSSDEK
ncbi:MAG: hypothetical protein Q8L29_00735 [archaeon]|nr:hypothetical protein [archaeon]